MNRLELLAKLQKREKSRKSSRWFLGIATIVQLVTLFYFFDLYFAQVLLTTESETTFFAQATVLSIIPYAIFIAIMASMSLVVFIFSCIEPLERKVLMEILERDDCA